MYESRDKPLVSSYRFAWRMFWHVMLAMVFIVVSIIIGGLGHVLIEEGVHWHDAALNAALIAGGIGPIMFPETYAGKVFFAFYGAYVSLVFAATLGVVLAPIAHRLLHTFHLDED